VKKYVKKIVESPYHKADDGDLSDLREYQSVLLHTISQHTAFTKLGSFGVR